MSLHLVLMFAGLVTLASMQAKPSSLNKSQIDDDGSVSGDEGSGFGSGDDGGDLGSGSCPSGWTLLATGCYRFLPAETFDEAKASCQRVGGYLVEVDDENENNILYQFYKDKVDDDWWVWLGATYHTNQAEWIWINSRKEMNFTALGSGEPNNNGKADCVVAWPAEGEFTWDSISCFPIYTNRKSLCEYTGKTPEPVKLEESLPSTQSPRIVEIEFLVDNERWNEYQEKYGKNPMANITEEIEQLLYDASQYLAKLDNGGYKLHLQKPLKRLENSPFELSSTYRDRSNNNLTRRLDKNDVVGYAFAFQDTISQMVSQGWTTKPNIVRYILASACPETWCRVGGLSAEAASEEVCLCHPETFPCIGIFTTKTSEKPSPVLLAHEIGHNLGSYHDEELGYIMSEPITGYEWSPGSRQQINDNNLGCLERDTTNRPTNTSTIPPTD